MTENCAWYLRWWHHRLRQADIDTMWAMLKPHRGVRAIQAWRRFMADRGQEHWRCPCSDKDPTTYRMKLMKASNHDQEQEQPRGIHLTQERPDTA